MNGLKIFITSNNQKDDVIDLYLSDNNHFVTLGQLMLSYYEDRPKYMNIAQLSGMISPDEMAGQGFSKLGENAHQIVYVQGKKVVIYSKAFNHTTYHPKLFEDSLGQLVDQMF